MLAVVYACVYSNHKFNTHAERMNIKNNFTEDLLVNEKDGFRSYDQPKRNVIYKTNELRFTSYKEKKNSLSYSQSKNSELLEKS